MITSDPGFLKGRIEKGWLTMKVAEDIAQRVFLIMELISSIWRILNTDFDNN